MTIVPVFADEAIYIRWAQVMKAEPTLRFLPLSDGKQPLFMWILMPVLSFFRDPLVAGRMLSVFSGVGTLLGIMFLAFLLFRSKWITLFSGLLYAVVPFTVFFDRMALVDSMLTMFGVWILSLGILLVRYQRIDLAMFTGFILGAALLTKSPATFFVLLLPLSAIYILFRQRKNLAVQLIKLTGLMLIVVIIGYAIYNILRLGPGFHMIALRNKDYIFTVREILSHPLDPFSPHLGQVWEWVLAYLGLPLVFAFLIGVISGIRKFCCQIIFLGICFFLPLLVQMSFAKVFTSRYILFTIPYFLIICSFGVYQISSFAKRSFSRYRTLTTTILLFLSAVTFFPLLRTDWFLITAPQKATMPPDERRGYLEEWTSGYGINEVRDYIKKYPRDKQIIVGTEGSFGTLPDGLQIYFDKDRQVTIIGVGLGLTKIPDQLKDSASKGNPTFLVANKSRMKDQNDPGLKLVLEIPKAEGKNGQDSLLLYQVR